MHIGMVAFENGFLRIRLQGQARTHQRCSSALLFMCVLCFVFLRTLVCVLTYVAVCVSWSPVFVCLQWYRSVYMFSETGPSMMNFTCAHTCADIVQTRTQLVFLFMSVGCVLSLHDATMAMATFSGIMFHMLSLLSHVLSRACSAGI